MKILIVGAGKIGRGFLAHLASRAGWSVTFVDRSAELVAELRRRGLYTIHLAAGDGTVERVALSGYAALDSSQEEAIAAAVLEADLLAVAVQPADLAGAADLLAPALSHWLAARPEGLNLILCANLPGAASVLRARLEALWGRDEHASLSRLGIVETIVIRTIPDPPREMREASPLDLLSSDYPELYLDRDAVVGTLPAIPGIVTQDRFREREIRKLYTYNMTHALLGFWGQAEGYVELADSFRDPWIRRQAQRALEEATAGVSGEFGFSREDMNAWNAGVYRLMENPHIGDRVERMIRDPLRKLARDERLTGPALLALKHGKAPRALARLIAYALRALGIGAERAGETCGLAARDGELERMIREAFLWIARERKASELGFEYEKRFKGCGQCTFAAVQEALGRSEERVFQALTAFAGGLGLCGDSICSALVGGAASFGLARGRRRDHFDGDRKDKYAAFAMAQALRERYLHKYGSLLCREVQERILGRSFDLRLPQERELFEAAGAHVDKCPRVVSDVARWSVQALAEEEASDVGIQT